MSLLQYSVARLFYFFPIYVLSILKGLSLLTLSIIFRGPTWVFKKKTRTSRPDCMNDPDLGTHKFIKVKDLTLHVVESGDPSKPLMLFLHGFPECWYSWRYQIKAFNKDYHVVAFDMRGVSESDAPAGVRNYNLQKLTGDVRDLIEALGHKSCILVAHDWGGIVGWCFAAWFPQMVDKFIPMNTPNPDRFAEISWIFVPQIQMSWYMYFFQLPYLPELMLSMGDYEMIRGCAEKGPATKEDVEAFKFAMSQPGRATTFLNYYRNLFQQLYAGTGEVKAPTMLIWGTNDMALHTKLTYDNEKFCPNIKVEKIEGGDHFIQQDKPDQVTSLMKEFLKK